MTIVNKSKHYLNNKLFLAYLREFQKLNGDLTRWFDKLKENTDIEIAYKLKKNENWKIRKAMLDQETPEEKNKREHKLVKVKNELGKGFLSITEGLLKKPNFINYDYSYKGDMTSDALYYMTYYVDRYNVELSNPFAYFTQVAFNAFLQRINKVNKNAALTTPLTYIENLGSPMSNISEGVYDD